MNKELKRVNQLEREIQNLKANWEESIAYQDGLATLKRELIDLYFELKGTTGFSLKLTDEKGNTYYLSDNKEKPLETVIIYFESEEEINNYLTLELAENYTTKLERKLF